MSECEAFKTHYAPEDNGRVLLKDVTDITDPDYLGICAYNPTGGDGGGPRVQFQMNIGANAVPMYAGNPPTPGFVILCGDRAPPAIPPSPPQPPPTPPRPPPFNGL